MNLCCEECGEELSIHVLYLTNNFASEQNNSSQNNAEMNVDLRENLYCPYCEKLETNNIEDESNTHICYDCGTSYRDYLNRGYLGCESCYFSFSPKLDRLMEDYHNVTPGAKAFSPSYEVSSMAKSRSLELCDYVLAKDNNQGDYIEKSSEKLSGNFNFTKSSNILSVRLRVARNIKGLAYLGYLSAEKRKALSENLLAPKNALAIYFSDDTELFLETRDEDHLRASWIFDWHGKEHCVNRLKSYYQKIEMLDKMYEWQFHPDYGFLTACPALCGKGIRLSFQLRLSSLRERGERGEWRKWLVSLHEAGYEIRASRGEVVNTCVSGFDSTSLSNIENNDILSHSMDSMQSIEISNRHWALNVCIEEEINRFFSVLENLSRNFVSCGNIR